MTNELKAEYKAVSELHRGGLLNAKGEERLSRLRTQMQLSGQGLELNHEDNFDYSLEGENE